MNTEKLAAFVRDSKQMAESELRRTLIVEEDKRAELQQVQNRIKQLQSVIAECDEALNEDD